MQQQVQQALQQYDRLQTSVADVEANLALSVYEQLLLVTIALAALTVVHQALLWFWRRKWPDGARPLPALLAFPRVEIIAASATIVCMSQVATDAFVQLFISPFVSHLILTLFLPLTPPILQAIGVLASSPYHVPAGISVLAAVYVAAIIVAFTFFAVMVGVNNSSTSVMWLTKMLLFPTGQSIH